MREEVVWTYLSPPEIAAQLADRGTPVCTDTVRSLLDELGFVRCKAQKSLAMGASPFRNVQFENIAWLKAEYLESDDPIISMDTKKKEHLGNFCRDGRRYAAKAIKTFDHDFPDCCRRTDHSARFVRLQTQPRPYHPGLQPRHERIRLRQYFAVVACYGEAAYPRAKSILLLCDGGGSNNVRHYIFKEDLQRLVNKIEIPIRVCITCPIARNTTRSNIDFFLT